MLNTPEAAAVQTDTSSPTPVVKERKARASYDDATRQKVLARLKAGDKPSVIAKQENVGIGMVYVWKKADAAAATPVKAKAKAGAAKPAKKRAVKAAAAPMAKAAAAVPAPKKAEEHATSLHVHGATVSRVDLTEIETEALGKSLATMVNELSTEHEPLRGKLALLAVSLLG